MSISYHLSLAQNLSEVFVKILKSRSFGSDDLLDLRPVCNLWTIRFFLSARSLFSMVISIRTVLFKRWYAGGRLVVRDKFRKFV